MIESLCRRYIREYHPELARAFEFVSKGLVWEVRPDELRSQLETFYQRIAARSGSLAREFDANTSIVLGIMKMLTCISESILTSRQNLDQAEIEVIIAECAEKARVASSFMDSVRSYIPSLTDYVLSNKTTKGLLGEGSASGCILLRDGRPSTSRNRASWQTMIHRAAENVIAIAIDEPEATLHIFGDKTPVTPLAFRLLLLLSLRPVGTVFLYEEIGDFLWNGSADNIGRKSLRDRIQGLLRNNVWRLGGGDSKLKQVISVRRAMGLRINEGFHTAAIAKISTLNRFRDSA